MDQIKLEELAVAYPDQEDLVQVYKEWGILRICRSFLKF